MDDYPAFLSHARSGSSQMWPPLKVTTVHVEGGINDIGASTNRFTMDLVCTQAAPYYSNICLS